MDNFEDNLLDLINYEPHALQVLDYSSDEFCRMECSNGNVSSSPSLIELQNVAMNEIFIEDKSEESNKIEILDDDSIPEIASYSHFERNLRRYKNDSFENVISSTIKAPRDSDVSVISENKPGFIHSSTFNTWTTTVDVEVVHDIHINSLPTDTVMDETEITSYLDFPHHFEQHIHTSNEVKLLLKKKILSKTEVKDVIDLTSSTD